MSFDAKSQQVDAAIADYLEAIERGAPRDRDDFLRNHPDMADELREFFADYDALQQAAPRSGLASAATSVANGSRDAAPFAVGDLPRTFGQFVLLKEIARGGMGVVYKARQATPARIVALKMILTGRLASPREVERFHVEAQAAAALDHPNIVPVFEVGQVDDQVYFTMGFVGGCSAAERIAESPLPPRAAARIVRDAAGAVHYAHGQGIVHRDLKPGNILLDDDERVRVTDFGLAKRHSDEDAHITKTGQLLGTPNFMSPEQLSGRTDDIGPESDVYSLGATLYAMLTGRPPFQAASIADVLRQVAEQDPAPPRRLDAAIPRDLETIALKCLEKHPARRYASAQGFADDLERFLRDQPIMARRATPWERAFRWGRRNPVAAGLAAAVAALVVLAVGVLVASNASIRRQSAARAAALQQKDAALITARNAVNQMLTQVANEKIEDVAVAYPLRISLLQDALRFYEALAPLADEDQTVSHEMAGVLSSMAALQREMGERDEAIRSLRRGIELLAAIRPPQSLASRELAAELELHLAYVMGESLLSARANEPTVEAQYRRALTLLRELEQLDPGRPRCRVLCLRFLAERAVSRGDRQQAEEHWREAFANGESCLAANPTNVDDRVSLAWAHVEFFNRILRGSPPRLPEAEPLLVTARNHARRALQLRPGATAPRDVMAAIHLSLATTRCRTGDVARAIPLYRQAVAEIESLCAAFPWTDAYWHSLIWFHQDLAENLRGVGRLEDAQDSLRELADWLAETQAALPAERRPRKIMYDTRLALVDLLRSVDLGDDADNLASSLTSTE
jgi:tRNA A-37 threonylcarbamoyl transferase component Bud32/tetratricopeptide (TPR) repeat protein